MLCNVKFWVGVVMTMAVAGAAGVTALAGVTAEPPADERAGQDQKQTTAARPDKAGAGATDDAGKTDVASAGAVKVGEAAPAFVLKDTEGKTVDLSDYLPKTAADGTVTPGKIIVLEWFNPDCPFIKKHHVKNKTMVDLAARHGKEAPGRVVWLAINSAAQGKEGHGKEKNAKARADYAMPYAVLLDEEGAAGKAYGAKTTPHMFVIGADGKVAYSGAIDNDRGRDVGTINYVARAVEELLAGQRVTTPETKPYGCSVKYGE